MGKSIIVSGFPGIGKSVLCDGVREMYMQGIGDIILMDIESSNFGWYETHDGERKRTSKWEIQYIDYVVQTLKVFERPNKTIVAFVSSHDNVRQELVHRGLEFTVVYPSIDRKEEFLERYRKRGNTEAFINNADTMFGLWINGIENTPYPKCKKYKMDKPMRFIAMELKEILEL